MTKLKHLRRLATVGAVFAAAAATTTIVGVGSAFAAGPTVTAVTPATGTAAGGTSVTLTGTGFSTSAGGTTVNFVATSGNPGTTEPATVSGGACTSSTSCTVTTPATVPSGNLGTYDITVTVSSLTSSKGAADEFTYLSASRSAATSPEWITGTVETDRTSGSDATFFLMQKISDLYNQAGLYGCALSADDYTCQDDSSTPAASGDPTGYNDVNDPNNSNGTTDYTDNYDRTEEVQGVDEDGSGAAQAQLCDNDQGPNFGALPPWAAIDYARSGSGISSKQDSQCTSAEREDFFAADAVDLLDFHVNPSVYGAATSTTGGSGSGYDYGDVNGGQIGDVALGWIPPAAIGSWASTDGAESLTCDTAKTGTYGQFGNGVNNCAGLPFKDLDNTSEPFATHGEFAGATSGDNGGTGPSAVAYDIWCQTTNPITDWGQLTNVGPFTLGVPTDAVGSGTPIGIHINLVGVNPSSGVITVWTTFAEGSLGSGSACNSNVNETTATWTSPTQSPVIDTHLALENNTAQIDDFAATDFPGDLPDQAVELATALYYVANGVYNASPYQSSVALTAGGIKNNGTLKSFPGQLMSLNVNFPTPTNIFPGASAPFPTARWLGNIYLSSALTGVPNSGIRASTAGFLNWICDDNSSIQKGTDLSTGLNYDAEVNTLINTTYGYERLDDTNDTGTSETCPIITAVVSPNN